MHRDSDHVARWASRLGLIAAVCLVLVGLVAPSAHADTGTRIDKVGDAPDNIDITKFTVRNGNARLTLKLHVVDLPAEGGFGFKYHKPNRSFFVDVNRERGKNLVEVVYCGEVSCENISCKGLRVRWSAAKNDIRARVPQACYPGKAPASATFLASGADKSTYDHTEPILVRRG